MPPLPAIGELIFGAVLKNRNKIRLHTRVCGFAIISIPQGQGLVRETDGTTIKRVWSYVLLSRHRKRCGRAAGRRRCVAPRAYSPPRTSLLGAYVVNVICVWNRRRPSRRSTKFSTVSQLIMIIPDDDFAGGSESRRSLSLTSAPRIVNIDTACVPGVVYQQQPRSQWCLL